RDSRTYTRCSPARSTTPESTEPMRARTRSPGRAFPPEPRRKYSRRAARTTSDALRPDLRAVRSSAVASSAGRRTVSCDSIMHYIVVHLQCMRQRGAGGANRGQDGASIRQGPLVRSQYRPPFRSVGGTRVWNLPHLRAEGSSFAFRSEGGR